MENYNCCGLYAPTEEYEINCEGTQGPRMCLDLAPFSTSATLPRQRAPLPNSPIKSSSIQGYDKKYYDMEIELNWSDTETDTESEDKSDGEHDTKSLE